MARNKQRPVESAFGDWPKMEPVPGERAIRLTGTYTAPSWWWSVGFRIGLLFLIIYVLLPASCAKFADVTHYGDITHLSGTEVGYFTLAWVIGGLAILIAGETFGRRRQLRITMRPETIEINGRTYQRAEGLNQFSVEEHEKRFEEARTIQRGQGNRLYLDAMQVVMRYHERRVVIADFRDTDEDKAAALFRRLQWLDREFDRQMAEHDSVPASPADDQDEFGQARPIR